MPGACSLAAPSPCSSWACSRGRGCKLLAGWMTSSVGASMWTTSHCGPGRLLSSAARPPRASATRCASRT
eukprot:9280419-Pyramimonas_sp.AAC.1